MVTRCEGRKSILLMKMIKLLWRFICFSSLLVVLVWRSSHYFSYPAHSESFFHTPERFRIPHVSLCFSLQSLIQGRVQYFFQESESESNFLDRTIENLYNQTPRVNETISSCGHRDLISKEFVYKNASECESIIFQVEKYRMHGYMCYRYKILGRKATSSLFGIAYRLKHPNVIFQISVNSLLSQGHKMCPIIHHGEFPVDDRNLDQEILPSRTRREAFYLSYDSITVYHLKAPYETDCQDSQTRCFLNCTRRIYSKYKLARAYGISFKDEFNFTLPTFNGSYDGNKLIEIMHRADKCVQICRQPTCIYEVTRTFVSPIQGKGKNGMLTFVIKNVANPILVMKFVPHMTLIEFATELANISAIIVSFSILGCLLISSDCNKPGPLRPKFNEALHKVKIIKRNNRTPTLKNIITLSAISGRQMPRKKHQLVRIAEIIRHCFAILCLSFQIVQLSYSFFEYRTNLILTFESNPIIDPYPKLVVCFRTYHFLGSKSYTLRDQSNHDQLEQEEARLQDLTLNQMMRRTPSENDAMEGCRMRPSQDQYPALRLTNSDLCRKYFAIDKFLWGRTICYRFTIINAPYNQSTITPDYFRQQFVKALVVHPGLLFSVILGPQLNSRHLIYMSVYPGNIELTPDALFVSLLRNGHNNTLCLLSVHVLNATLLPRPYQTDCNVHQNIVTTCSNSCLLKYSRHLNRLPRQGIWNESQSHSHLKLQTYLDDRNKSFYLEMRYASQKCSKTCRSCEKIQSITYVRTIDKSETKLELAVDSHAIPIWFLQAVPETSLYRYLFNLFCLLNFWYGLSLITFDPTNYYHHKKLIESSFFKQYVAMNNFTNRLLQLIRVVVWKKFKFTRIKLFLGKRILLALSISPICLLHVHHEIESYCQYPSTMYSYTEVEETDDADYELAICLDVQEIIALKYNVSIDSFSLQGITLQTMFSLSPGAENLVTACGFHGINGSASSGDVTDQSFFYEFNPNICHRIFSHKKYLMKGFICYQFNKRKIGEEEIEYPGFMKKFSASKMIAINSSLLTRRIMINAAILGGYPWIGGLWSLIMKPSHGFQMYSVSYLKYKHNKLPWYYSQGDLGEVTYGKCYTKCIDKFMKPFGLVYHALHTQSEYGSSKSCYLTSEERSHPKVGPAYKKIAERCATQCHIKDKLIHQEQFDYLATRLVSICDDKDFEIIDSKSFYLVDSEKPVMIVTFLPAYTILQLLINLGSIVAIWFGLSVSSVEVLRIAHERDNRITVDQLDDLNYRLDEAINGLDELDNMFSHSHRAQ